MSLLDYLDQGLLGAHGMREDLDGFVVAVAEDWRRQQVDPAPVEVAAELLARCASYLGAAAATREQLLEALRWLELPETVLSLVEKAALQPLPATAVAGLAVHLIDIAEHLALDIYIPELPALHAKSDRTGAAARHVGVARHLKG